jgi:hypothetical protein
MNWDLGIAITVGATVLMCIMYLIMCANENAVVVKEWFIYSIVTILLLLGLLTYLQVLVIDLRRDIQIAESKLATFEKKGIEITENETLWMGNVMTIDLDKICSDRSKNGSKQ